MIIAPAKHKWRYVYETVRQLRTWGNSSHFTTLGLPSSTPAALLASDGTLTIITYRPLALSLSEFGTACIGCFVVAGLLAVFSEDGDGFDVENKDNPILTANDLKRVREHP